MKSRPFSFFLLEKALPAPPGLNSGCDEGDWRRLGQKHYERVTTDLMTKGSIQWSAGRWQTHSGRDYNPGKVTDMSAAQLSALSPAAKRLQVKGSREKEPQPSDHFGNQKRKHSPPHLRQNVFPNYRRTEKSNVLERLQQTESHLQKLQKTRPGTFHKAEMA